MTIIRFKSGEDAVKALSTATGSKREYRLVYNCPLTLGPLYWHAGLVLWSDNREDSRILTLDAAIALMIKLTSSRPEPEDFENWPSVRWNDIWIEGP